MRLLALVCVAAGAQWSALAMACELTIAYSSVPSPPYFIGEGETIPEKPGLAVELVNVAASDLGCKVKWVRLPGKRALLELQQGRVDGMLLLSHNEERATYAAYPMIEGKLDASLRMANLRYSVYVKGDSTLEWDGRQFDRVPRAVAANAGYSVVADLKAIGLTAVEERGTNSSIKSLRGGYTEAYIGQDLQVDQVLEEGRITDVKKLPVPFSSKDYFLPFSKAFFDKSADVANGLWRQIVKVKRTHGKALQARYADQN